MHTDIALHVTTTDRDGGTPHTLVLPLTSVRVMHLDEGDSLVLTLPESSPADTVRHCIEQLRVAFPAADQVLVLVAPTEVEVIKPSATAEGKDPLLPDRENAPRTPSQGVGGGGLALTDEPS